MITAKKIVLGTVQFGLNYGINNASGKITSREVYNILEYAQSVGIDTLDTAAGYGDSEEKIGDFHLQNKPFNIVTKFDKGLGISWEESIQQSLTKLKTSIVEVVMFHSFETYYQNRNQLPEIIRKGKNRYFNNLGVSVYTNAELEALVYDENVQIVQVPFNLLDNENHRGSILEKLNKKGKTIYARSIFLQGLFYKALDQIPLSLNKLTPHLYSIRKLSEKEGIDINALAIQYVCSKKYIDRVVIGVDNKSQLKKNIEAVKYTLNSKIIDQIDSIKVDDVSLLNPSKWKI